MFRLGTVCLEPDSRFKSFRKTRVLNWFESDRNKKIQKIFKIFKFNETLKEG